MNLWTFCHIAATKPQGSLTDQLSLAGKCGGEGEMLAPIYADMPKMKSSPIRCFQISDIRLNLWEMEES